MFLNPNALVELQKMAPRTRVFLSMPYIEGITPACMDHATPHDIPEELEIGLHRRDGYFAINEAGLSPLDHGNLYGDGVFEGIRIVGRRILLLKEHIERWFNSAQKIGLEFPYTRDELTHIIVELSRQSLGNDNTTGYIRPVLTRGLGNLGVNPAKCIAPTLYIIASSISLYPAQRYTDGINVSIARKIRRNDLRHLDPNAKTNNYLNNVLALLETRATGALETIMLTDEGYVAEATADNIFIAQTLDGKPTLTYPAAPYALVGLTRNLIISLARKLGFTTCESATLLPTDLVGSSREVFITGTACGLMPVKTIEGIPNADPQNRPLTDQLRNAFNNAMENDSEIAISIDASKTQIDAYIHTPFAVPLSV